jgi:DNA-binding CsgD family transcriptional regulator
LAAFDQPCLDSVRACELLTEAELAVGEVEQATSQAGELATFGARAGCALVVARGQRALGLALAARGDADSALGCLQRALDGFGRLGMPFAAARTSLALATLLAEPAPDAAVARARSALTAFERLGADADADTAAALLRSLGVKAARGGPAHSGPLTRREREVLGLLAEGLSNQQLAERLVLSRRTVEHHVASVLAKLGVSSRAEAVAYAVRHPDRDPATT